jgi:predicted PurR-regulated permease PerM
MTEPIVITSTSEGERRRVDRRLNARVGDLTLPELRRILITTTLGAVVLVAFLWMVRTVVIAAILGLIIGFYLRPLYGWILAKTHRRTLSGILTLVGVILPILLVLVYSYSELSDAGSYVATHQDEIAQKVNEAVRRLPFLKNSNASEAAGRMVVDATAYGTRLPLILRSALAGFSIAATIFIFTAFYILIEAENIGNYLGSKIPPRYEELRRSLEVNVRGVLYGAIYSTLLTQTLKSLIILGMNLVFQVPLAGALAVVSFIIGFFPIVGSWSVYVPVAIWLAIFRNQMGAAILMVIIGTVVNTMFISMYLRPKIAADRSRVLNFYWMFVALITGVYTFGLAGILIGPILIGLLKAVIDSVTARTSWQLIDLEDEDADVDLATPASSR